MIFLICESLAFAVDVEISQITDIERGKIHTSVLNVLKIIDALGISKADLEVQRNASHIAKLI